MGSEKSRAPGAGADEQPGRREVNYLDQAGPEPERMRVREAAVLTPRGAAIDPARYPELVQRTLGHVDNVLDRLEADRLEIVRLRSESREALARLKAA